MKNLQYLLTTMVIFSALMILAYSIDNTNAIPPSLVRQHFVFGPLLGISQNTNGPVDWLISGTWKSSLSNSTNVQNVNVFDAAIEMIKPDGTGRHTHALTNFTLQNITYPSSSQILFTGVSTINMKEGPILNVPTSIVLSNDKVISIMLDPQSVQNHFGTAPFYGIIVNNKGPMGGQTGGPMHP